mmetsp:Transcript_86762/g.136880  ORF Transcript_86762/g.136880 Transcript_86762/m.136880 type:complete len:134 (-) Transcript_86762:71-472(-)
MVRTMFDELMEKEERWNLKFFIQNRVARGLPIPGEEMAAEDAAKRRHRSERKSGRSPKRSHRSESQGSRRRSSADNSSQHSGGEEMFKRSVSTPELPAIAPKEKPVVSLLTRKIQFRRGDGGRIFSDTPPWAQ